MSTARAGNAAFFSLLAVGSFATQGSKALPPAVPRAEVFLSSMILILVVMFFWLVRVLLTNWYRRKEQS